MANANKRPTARKAAVKPPRMRRPHVAPDDRASPVPTAASAAASQAKRSRNPAMRAAAQIIEAQKMLLRAGLRVLRVDREPVVQDAPPASMEEVFDRRVASALQRLGMPDAADLIRLSERIDTLARQLDALQRKKPHRKAVP